MQSVAFEKVQIIKRLLFLFSQVKNDSFFNFFDPPTLPEDEEEEVDVDTQDLLTSDFEIGHYIRERVVPRAVLFFTGEALEGRRENLSSLYICSAQSILLRMEEKEADIFPAHNPD